jgi:hypothetical protein
MGQSSTAISIRCPGCDRGLITLPGRDEPSLHPACGGSGIDALALRRHFKISLHTLDLLRLITSRCIEGRWWLPGPKFESLHDRFPRHGGVSIGGGASASAIRSLDRLGYVEIVPGSHERLGIKYARRVTTKGWSFLETVFAAMA